MANRNSAARLPNPEDVSSRLAEKIPLILDEWEERVRLKLPAARHQDPPILRDDIPPFLLALARALSPAAGPEEIGAKLSISKTHGEQRAILADYSLDQVLREYHLLRKTVLEVLEAVTPLRLHEREAITDAIEQAMQEAAAQFMESHLRQQSAALAEADRRKDEFLAMVAHELRTPLSAISNAVYLLEHMELADERGSRQVATVTRQTRHLKRLAEDLLDVARITEGKIELRRQKLDLVRAAAEIAQSSLSLVEGRGQELTLTLPEEPIHIDADPVRLEQVITNLLTNAVKYTEAGGRIWLTVARAGGAALVRVRDTGVGIDPVMLPQIFDLFVQAPSGHRDRGGLGLGLTLVRRLVELHGGTVTANSSGPGQGAEFVVRLPLVEAEPSPDLRAVSEALEADAGESAQTAAMRAAKGRPGGEAL